MMQPPLILCNAPAQHFSMKTPLKSMMMMTTTTTTTPLLTTTTTIITNPKYHHHQEQQQQQQHIEGIGVGEIEIEEEKSAEEGGERLERLPCGIVYTWNCAGEPYAIECALCEERPLCTLNEFSEHMEIWHSDWHSESSCGSVQSESSTDDDGHDNDVHADNVHNAEDNDMKTLTEEHSVEEFVDVHDEIMQEVLAELTATGELRIIVGGATADPKILNDEVTMENIDEHIEENKEIHVEDNDEIEERDTDVNVTDDIDLEIINDIQTNDDFLKEKKNQSEHGNLEDNMMMMMMIELDSTMENCELPSSSSSASIGPEDLLKLTTKTNKHNDDDCDDEQNIIESITDQITNLSTEEQILTNLLESLEQEITSTYPTSTTDYYHHQQQQQQQQHDLLELDENSITTTTRSADIRLSQDQVIMTKENLNKNQQSQAQEHHQHPEPFEEIHIENININKDTKEMEQEEGEGEQQQQGNSGYEVSEPREDLQTLSPIDQIKYGMNEPLPTEKKLTAKHVGRLIELYKEEPRLWNQSHPEFRDTELCRQSWQTITEKWNVHCQRQFTITEIRIRISTLCQRFMKQRERLEAEGELDECIKFAHYESLTFLVEQQTLQNRREIFESENRKLIDIYRQYPVLWHTAHRNTRCPAERTEAYQAISSALQLFGIKLTTFGVQRRLQSLRKCYRLEKIRYLHDLVETREGNANTMKALEYFESDFKHYWEMEFLHKHIDPYVCAGCGKISENLVTHREHINNLNQGCWQANGDFDLTDEEEVMSISKISNASSKVMTDPTTITTAAAEPTDTDIDTNASELVNPIVTTIMQPKTDRRGHENSSNDDSNTRPEQEDLNDNNSPSDSELIVKVECAQFSYNLRLRSHDQHQQKAESDQTIKINTSVENKKTKTKISEKSSDIIDDKSIGSKDNNDVDVDNETVAINLVARKDRLSVQHTHDLIALYKGQPTLWDPNHLDYHSRKQRHQAWEALTEQLNEISEMQYTWQQLHRKLTDYAKYYRREKQRLESTKGSCTKWCFYDDFKFLDDVLIINIELQKTLQQRDNNLKIIEVYKAHPQLWCTDHLDYSKRKQRQRHTESMCTRLQEECNIHITSEKLKSRLIEFRFQYRQEKEQRLKFLREEKDVKTTRPWEATYEYYDVLSFLENHVSPFICARCGSNFKRRTDYLQHERKAHGDNDELVMRRRRAANKSESNTLEHICHICGLTFSMRNNLLAHLRRHMGQRNFACNTCPKKFFNSTSLSVHMRSHTKETPYVCEHCARGFVNASKLNQHVKRHRNQRDFPCNRCDKAFYTAFERDRHVRCHLNIRDKVCPICGRAFVVGSAYYSHLNLHRDSKRYACEQCGQRFAQYAGLYKHRKRCTVTKIVTRE